MSEAQLFWLVRDQLTELFTPYVMAAWRTIDDDTVDLDQVRELIEAGDGEPRPWLTWTTSERADPLVHMRRIAWLATNWNSTPDDPLSMQCDPCGIIRIHDGHHRLRAAIAGMHEGLYTRVSGDIEAATALLGAEGLVDDEGELLAG